MAPPVGAWRRYPPNRGFTPSSAAAKRLNDGFTARPTRPRLKAKTKTRAPLGKLRGKMGKKGWMAAGMIPVVAGLGTLLGSVLKPKSNKKQEGRGNTPWRVLTHQPFLLTLTSGGGPGWGRQIQQASTEELRALTDLIRNVYDGVIPIPTEVKVPLKKHIKEIRRLSGLTTPLYERRALLLSLGKRLLPFVRAGLNALTR